MEARKGPYGRIYDSWINEWSRTGLSATQMSIMCKLCERLEFDVEGNATAWYPREEMARELGKTERAIKQAVHSLLKAARYPPKNKERRTGSPRFASAPK